MADADGMRRELEKQALMRVVNDEIEDLNATFGTLLDDHLVLCECGRTRCLEQIRVPGAEYGRLRALDGVFVVAPGHEQTELERVVREEAGFRVVELLPHARRLARRLSL